MTQLTIHKTCPPLVTVAMPDIQCRSHTTHMLLRSEKYITEQWEETNNTNREGFLIWNKVSAFKLCHFKRNSNNKYCLWLFNVSWQITLMPQFNHVNRSSFHIYLKHELNMNKHQKVFHFNHRTPFFKCKSIEVNLLFDWFVLRLEVIQLLGMRIYIFSEPTM